MTDSAPASTFHPATAAPVVTAHADSGADPGIARSELVAEFHRTMQLEGKSPRFSYLPGASVGLWQATLTVDGSAEAEEFVGDVALSKALAKSSAVERFFASRGDVRLIVDEPPIAVDSEVLSLTNQLETASIRAEKDMTLMQVSSATLERFKLVADQLEECRSIVETRLGEQIFQSVVTHAGKRFSGVPASSKKLAKADAAMVFMNDLGDAVVEDLLRKSDAAQRTALQALNELCTIRGYKFDTSNDDNRVMGTVTDADGTTIASKTTPIIEFLNITRHANARSLLLEMARNGDVKAKEYYAQVTEPRDLFFGDRFPQIEGLEVELKGGADADKEWECNAFKGHLKTKDKCLGSYICAFLNKKIDGQIVYGVHDRGTIQGFDLGNDLSEAMDEINKMETRLLHDKNRKLFEPPLPHNVVLRLEHKVHTKADGTGDERNLVVFEYRVFGAGNTTDYTFMGKQHIKTSAGKTDIPSST